jgi:hypothetical protein
MPIPQLDLASAAILNYNLDILRETADLESPAWLDRYCLDAETLVPPVAVHN